MKAADPSSIWTDFGIIWRIGVAFVLGLLFHAVFIFRFASYAQRNRPEHALHYILLPVAMAVAGFLLVYRAPRAAMAVPAALTSALLAANIVLIVVECWKDPTNHNLWPLELVFLLILYVPAWVGAGVARLVSR